MKVWIYKMVIIFRSYKCPNIVLCADVYLLCPCCVGLTGFGPVMFAL